MIFHAATDADLARLSQLIVPDPACGLNRATYRTRSERGEYRPEWTWIAEADHAGADHAGADHAGADHAADHAGPVLAVGIWWGPAGMATPNTPDALFAHDSLPQRGRPAGRPWPRP